MNNLDEAIKDISGKSNFGKILAEVAAQKVAFDDGFRLLQKLTRFNDYYFSMRNKHRLTV